jgi:hypothetical protein
MRKTCEYVAVLACAVLVLAGTAALAGDKDKAALSGTWVKKAGELKVAFADKDVLKLVPHADESVIVILCDYTADKEGRVKAKITGFEGKDEVMAKVKDRLPVGTEFSFRWQVKDDAATLDEVKAGDNTDLLKSHMEGEFERKK